MTPNKQLDALVEMFPDLIWRKGENKFLFRTGTCALCDPLHCREDTLSLIKLPGFFSNRKTFVQELVYVMDRDFGSGADISNSDTLNPTEITAWLMLDATAPQLLEAVLRTGGVWEEQHNNITAKVDPHVKLKQAHKGGKVIEVKDSRSGDWCPAKENHCWTFPVESYRIKPPFQLPPEPPGMSWHRKDGWTAEDLPQGYRPLFDGEKRKNEDEWKYEGDETWRSVLNYGPVGATVGTTAAKHRTRRPLTFDHKGKTWTYHRPGDPMPCDKNAEVACLTSVKLEETLTFPAHAFGWGETEEKKFAWGFIIGWCYIGEPKIGGINKDTDTEAERNGSHADSGVCLSLKELHTAGLKFVELGPEDVPPGSVFRPSGWPADSYTNFEAVVKNGIRTIGRQWSEFCDEHGYLPWSELKLDWLINRSLPLTGKWNPDAWEPCHKQVPAS